MIGNGKVLKRCHPMLAMYNNRLTIMVKYVMVSTRSPALDNNQASVSLGQVTKLAPDAEIQVFERHGSGQVAFQVEPFVNVTISPSVFVCREEVGVIHRDTNHLGLCAILRYAGNGQFDRNRLTIMVKYVALDNNQASVSLGQVTKLAPDAEIQVFERHGSGQVAFQVEPFVNVTISPSVFVCREEVGVIHRDTNHLGLCAILRYAGNGQFDRNRLTIMVKYVALDNNQASVSLGQVTKLAPDAEIQVFERHGSGQVSFQVEPFVNVTISPSVFVCREEVGVIHRDTNHLGLCAILRYAGNGQFDRNRLTIMVKYVALDNNQASVSLGQVTKLAPDAEIQVFERHGSGQVAFQVEPFVNVTISPSVFVCREEVGVIHRDTNHLGLCAILRYAGNGQFDRNRLTIMVKYVGIVRITISPWCTRKCQSSRAHHRAGGQAGCGHLNPGNEAIFPG
ncbi:hypothetical protein TNCV_3168121 [Trichonephila clavipes]|nr:hypothetical protein TNCV_3168121 [Trichonephila clavipes]